MTAPIAKNEPVIRSAYVAVAWITTIGAVSEMRTTSQNGARSLSPHHAAKAVKTSRLANPVVDTDPVTRQIRPCSSSGSGGAPS